MMTDFFATHSARLRTLTWAGILIVCSLSLYGELRSGYRFDTSVIALLPTNSDTTLLAQSRDKITSQFANRMLFLIGGDKSDIGSDELASIATEFKRNLANANASQNISILNESPSLQASADVYRSYRYGLLSDADRAELEAGNVAQLIRRAQQQLLSPASSPRLAGLSEDPLNLFQRYLIDQIDKARGNVSVDAHGLKLETAREHYRLIPAVIKGNAFDIGVQDAVLASIADARSTIEHPHVQLLQSGLVFHAAAGARQAKSEISTIGIGSLIGIIALLIWYFRSPAPLLMAVTTLAGGMLFAFAISIQVFDRLHMLTLAFGAGLIGVAIDYTLHYCCARRQLGADAMRHILPGISLGLVSSMLAYSVIAVTPFPGLRQMAFFSGCGLLGAWLTLICFYSSIQVPAQKNQKSSSLAKLPRWLIARRPATAKLIPILFVIIAAGSYTLRFSDDVRNLQSSPANLLEQEKIVQSLLKSPASSQYFLIQGDSAESVLVREEALRASLDQMIANGESGEIAGYQALTQTVPSLARQAVDYRLSGQAFYHRLERIKGLTEPLRLPPAVADEIAQQYHQHAGHHLTFTDWRDASRGEAITLWLESGDRFASILPLIPATQFPDFATLSSLAATIPGVQYVDSVQAISDTLKSYRLSVSGWIMLAYALLSLILLLRYGRTAVRIVTPPLLATLITLATLSLMGQGISLFNMLACLLILGIGLDIGIFLTESAHQNHAWEATILSTITTLLAFGLLALSKTPVLHQFGITVLPGIALTWLLAMQFSPAVQNEQANPESIS